MRVLHIQRVAGVGGSERHLSALLPALARRDVDVHMCVLATADAHRFLEGLSTGIPTTVIPAGPDVNPLAVGRLVAEMRRFRPDLVHTHLLHGDTHGQVAARAAGVRAVSTFHACPPFYQRQPYRAVARVTGRLPRLIIAISDHLGRFLVDEVGVPPERVRVVHYGIDPTGWRLGDAERRQARAHLANDDDRLIVGVASRLVPEKGHADLIDAISLAIGRCDRLRLVMAGDGPLRHDLEQHARRVLPAGSYRFCGFVEDIRAFMNGCDVFTFPTTAAFGEGFGMAALEASAAGRPVVGTDVGPIPEVVADGESGRIVPASSPSALAEAILELALDDSLRHRLGEGAARRARDVFGLDRMVDSTRAVYDEATATVA